MVIRSFGRRSFTWHPRRMTAATVLPPGAMVRQQSSHKTIEIKPDKDGYCGLEIEKNVVVAIERGNVADKQGRFKIGDRIIAVNGVSLEDKAVNEVMGGEKEDVLDETIRKKSYVFKIERVKSTRSLSRGRSRDRIESPVMAVETPVQSDGASSFDKLTEGVKNVLSNTFGTGIGVNHCLISST